VLSLKSKFQEPNPKYQTDSSHGLDYLIGGKFLSIQPQQIVTDTPLEFGTWDLDFCPA
jgi:hypothetical protein